MRSVLLRTLRVLSLLVGLSVPAGVATAAPGDPGWPARAVPSAATVVAVASTEAFVAGTEDLPLMAGLRQVPERGVVFDSERGRIVEAYAVGYVPADRVRGFYRRSLPQLGWQTAGDLTFWREGEVLIVDFPAGPDPLTVRFRITPGP